MQSPSCLDDETVLGFLEGRLNEDELGRVESHALGCDACQELIDAGLAAGSLPKGRALSRWRRGGDAMASAEVSCRFLVPLLDLAAERIPPAEVSDFLGLWRTTVAALGHESGWVTRRFCEGLVEWLAEQVGVDAIIDRVSTDTYSPKAMGLLYPFVRAFGSPRVAYARLGKFVRLLNRASAVEVQLRGRNRATITYRPLSEATRERSPLICRVRRAQLAAAPTIWSLPLAVVEESECQAQGGDRCVYRMTWVQPTHWWRSLSGGAVLATGAWLASGHNWVVAALAMAGSVAGVHLWGARRDLKELETLEELKMSLLGQVERVRPSAPADRAGGTGQDVSQPRAIVPPRAGAKAIEAPVLPLPQTGQLLAGRYRLGPVLGAGGMGFVFSATDEATNQVVALKVLRPELSVKPRWVERMEREVRIARTIRNAHVCHVMSFGQVDGYCFLTMELASGTLHRELRGQGSAKAWEDRVADAEAIVLGLVAIHRAGIVHRDLTPQNILRFPGGRLAIADFGLALDQPAKTTQVAGTPHHIAPEVMRGAKASFASDVWQLGVILYEVLYGLRPTPEALAEDRASPDDTEDPDTRARRRLRDLCLACMHEEPLRRPQSASAVESQFPALAATIDRTGAGW